MNDDLDRLFTPGDPPDAATLSRISAQLAATAKPVRPLPSNTVLWSIAIGVFAIVACVMAAVTGFLAIASLKGWEMAIYYGVIAVFAGLFARAVTERMIPGERHTMSSALLWSSAIAVLCVLMLWIYSDRSTEHFVARGIPCLRMGMICALISGLLGWRLLRRGYLVSPRETIVLYGFFAGLVGVAALALHCPQRNSLHFLVWHIGAMLFSGLLGLLIGKWTETRSDGD